MNRLFRKEKVNDLELLEEDLERKTRERTNSPVYSVLERVLKYSLVIFLGVLGISTVVALVLKIRHSEEYTPPLFTGGVVSDENLTAAPEEPVEKVGEYGSEVASHKIVGEEMPLRERVDFSFEERPSEEPAQNSAGIEVGKPLLFEEEPAVPPGRVVFSTSTLKPVVDSRPASEARDNAQDYSPSVPSPSDDSSICLDVNKPVLMTDEPAVPELSEPSHALAGF